MPQLLVLVILLACPLALHGNHQPEEDCEEERPVRPCVSRVATLFVFGSRREPIPFRAVRAV